MTSPESPTQETSSWGVARAAKWLMTVLGIAAVAYHMLLVHVNIWDSTYHYIAHLTIILVIAALAAIADAAAGWDRGINKLKMVAAVYALITGLATMAYYAVNALELELSQPFITETAMIVTGFAVSAIMVLCWIHWGGIITLFTLASIVYFIWGHNIPGALGHPEYEMNFIMSYMGASLTLGMFGPILKVSADVIFLFVIFGSLFRYTGVLPLFLELGKAVGNLVRGGAAFPAVIGSGFVGTVTGAAVANVVLTGSATIPTMKQTGFKPQHAAAIEAVASTGGQIMPPIMGSAAFLMSSFLEVPYVEIMKKALIPALLFYISAGIGVYFLIRSAGLNPPKMDVSMRLVLRTLPVFVLPMTVVIWLLVGYYSPGYAAFAGILTMVLVALVQKETRPSLAQWSEGFTEAAKVGSQLALILALVGILAQVALTTNIATKLSQSVIGLVGVELIPILLISAVVAILLGMELPTPVAYVVMFVTVVPLMIDAGVDMFAANFFAFYFAILSTLTPPVALSVLAASRIAGCGFLEACAHSIRLSIVGYLLPFAMAFTPAILGFPDKVGIQGWTAIGCLVLASIAGSAAMYGYMLRPIGPLLRVVLGSAAIVGLGYVFDQQIIILLAFFALLAIGIIVPHIANQRDKAHSGAVT
ncbi:MAG: TRAP transporter permease [Hyphomicrobiaceae bacterium]